jgi:hypothetical protein
MFIIQSQNEENIHLLKQLLFIVLKQLCASLFNIVNQIDTSGSSVLLILSESQLSPRSVLTMVVIRSMPDKEVSVEI